MCLVALSGFRIREPEMFALGMKLPGLASRANAIGALPALGLLTLAALTPKEWSTSYHEAARIDDAFVHQIASLKPKLVAISALTASILEAYRLCDQLKTLGIPTVLGGLHATALPNEAALHAISVVVGDGEPVWPTICHDAATGQLRPLYQADSPFNLANAPIPKLELLSSKPRPRYTLQTARGCPFACDFCAASRVLGPFREKPVEAIERELAAIQRHDPRAVIELADDNTFAGRRDPRPMLDAFARSGIRYFTEADWRIGERPDVLESLAASGCAQVLIGFESMVHVHAGMAAKRASFERMLKAAERIQEAGVPVIACFIVGSEGETLESMHALADFLLEAPFADIQLTMLTPFPGSAIFDRLRAERKLLRDRSYESFTLFDATFHHDTLSTDQLERGFRNLVAMVFAPEPSLRRDRIRHSIWSKRFGSRQETLAP